MISLYTFRLPFKKPFITGHDTYTHREGVLIRYLDNSADLWSEASPLPGFSPDTFDDVCRFLANSLNEINAFFTSDFTVSDLKNQLQKWPQFPSLQYALSYLGLRVLALKTERAPWDFLPFGFTPELSINDVIGISDSEETRQKISDSFGKGFRTLKIKTGSSPGELAGILNEEAANCPGLQFRIDPNQSWPADRISEFSSLFSKLPVEYIEEPAAFDDLAELDSILAKSSCPVALDEGIGNIIHLNEIRKSYPEIYLVIKPALLGNLFDLAETISNFDGKRHRIVFSTLLESKIGREMTAFTAAKLGDPELAHGLNTGGFFIEDLLPDFPVNRGSIYVKNCIKGMRKPIRFEHVTILNGIHSK